MPSLTATEETESVPGDVIVPADDILADILGSVNDADEVGDMVINHSTAPTAFPFAWTLVPMVSIAMRC